MKKCKSNSSIVPTNKKIKYLEKKMEKLPSEEYLENTSGKIKAISDPTRLKIIYLLKEGELCVCEINFALDKPQSTISHHLNILKNAGFLKGRKEGVWIHYKLSNPSIINLIENLVKIN
ncbi:MAG: ArsR/SmtB family transcription factor [Methanomicrobiales archaeon]